VVGGSEGDADLYAYTTDPGGAVDADRLAFCLLMHGYDFTDLGSEVRVVFDTPNPGLNGYYLKGDRPLAFIAGLERIDGIYTPVPIRENPSREAPSAEPQWVWIGFAADLTLSDGTRMEGQYAMLTPRGSQDSLLLVPEGRWDIEGAAEVKGEALATFEEWHDYPPRGVQVAVDPPVPPFKKVSSPKKITYLSDKIMRDADAKGDVHIYNHDFTDTHSTLLSEDGTVMIAYEHGSGQAKSTNTLEIDRRGIIN